MANEFFVPTSGCGAPSNLPGVAVYNPEITCPGTGFGANTFASPATPLAVGLATPIARFTFSGSSLIRNVGFGVTEACLAVLEEATGLTILDACAEGVATTNTQADAICLWWCAHKELISGFIVKPGADVDSISAIQFSVNPCNPCFTSDVDFVCGNGCTNPNFILTNAVTGGSNALILSLPVTTGPIIVELCSCAPQVNSFATCPSPIPAVAQIAAGPGCPTPYAQNGNVYGNGVGAQVFTGQNRQF